MRPEALQHDAAATLPTAEVYVPPRELLRDTADARAYRRTTLVLVLLLYAALYAALCVTLPGGRAFVEELKDILAELRPRKSASAPIPAGVAIAEASIAKGVTP